MLGPYHRVETDTQTCADAIEQVRSGEIWGRAPRNGGMTPTVQAYTKPLPANRRGIEFMSPVDPHPNGSPLEVRWYLKLTPGVEERRKGIEVFASIAAQVQNRQPRIAE